eukprot:CAMPEP_0170629812 /NCGR_PEP_ID=MMETSP0224-20130122/33576_1 /TAXON_ID=285029 /ORGANISM="Togula jolla, Strain CCCM 725" /LENGTH=177 /DNA_ID=CAMNT_0010957647 /DNA_START=267 /DNA_END=802 /DNA_ORIENTATION=+
MSSKTPSAPSAASARRDAEFKECFEVDGTSPLDCLHEEEGDVLRAEFRWNEEPEVGAEAREVVRRHASCALVAVEADGHPVSQRARCASRRCGIHDLADQLRVGDLPNLSYPMQQRLELDVGDAAYGGPAGNPGETVAFQGEVHQFGQVNQNHLLREPVPQKVAMREEPQHLLLLHL